MKKLSLAYFGTPDFSAKFLEKLLSDKKIPVEVKLVVTQPDRPVGRKQTLTPSPVNEVAKKHRIPVLTSVRTRFSNIDLALLFAYGEIIPKNLLEIPRYGFWNIHPSLLPKYRGPSPIAYPLIDGETETGVTIIKMDEKIDHGPIIAQEKVRILPKERRPELTMRLTDVAYRLLQHAIAKCHAELVLRLAPLAQNGERNRTISVSASREPQVLKLVQDDMLVEQDHSKATYTKLLKKEDGHIEISNITLRQAQGDGEQSRTIKYQISKTPESLFNRFRGLYPWPGIWTKVRVKNKEKRLKITDMDLVDGKVIIKKVQLEGKGEVDFRTFLRAYNIRSLT
ncbi:methionyl-tRNA formyltransferase [Candidatus Roizmanbacteria bacterium]|nr:methionyl-tRNA formyltransferase [Candidatus Roizmanbacteria bacterium]